MPTRLYIDGDLRMQMRNHILTRWRADVSKYAHGSQQPMHWHSTPCMHLHRPDHMRTGSAASHACRRLHHARMHAEGSNHAIRRWLSLEDVQAGVLTELRHYARTVWTFLHTAGYINFGVAPAIAKRALGAPQDKGSVIIVGAGLAGMHACACFWLTLTRRQEIPFCPGCPL